MTWATNDYRTYPARCFTAVREAPLSAEPYHLGSWEFRSEAEAEALLHRRFRYLVRHQPGKDFSLDKILAVHSFRTKIFLEPFGVFALYLYSRAELPTELLDLNPELTDLILSECQ